MNVIPKYLFQAIPIFIPLSFFKSFNQVVSPFIWHKKSARIRKEFMERRKTTDGLSLPNLCTYYWAANLNTTFLWLKVWNGTYPAWLQIEQATSSPYSLPALFCASMPSIVNNVSGNVVVTQSLGILNNLKNAWVPRICPFILR